MADATTANVVIDRSWTENGITGKNRIGMLCRLTNGTFGSTTNKIPATAFGLRVIESCSGVWAKEDDSIAYAARPSYDGVYLHLSNYEQVTDADRTLPADVVLGSTAFLKGEVHGYA